MVAAKMIVDESAQWRERETLGMRDYRMSWMRGKHEIQVLELPPTGPCLP